MKRILVPTDFSECAANALDAAAQLAERFDATLHLLHSEDLPPYWEQLPEEEKQKWATVNQASDKAKHQLKQFKEKYPNLHLETTCTPKQLPAAISAHVEQHGIELIVIGSHGASGKNEFFIGSNTQKVVRTIHCPTLIIKNPLKDINFHKVVFASSFNESELEGFVHFKNLVKHFIPEIHLVYVQHSIINPPTQIQLETMKPFERACAPLQCQSHIYNDFSVDKGIRSFADKLGADLIAISYHERHPIKRMLIGSNVEAIINHAELPVLTIDFEN
ncbi:MAG: universal stress protein [Bacteroidota bacterium]